jgi:serine protease Do
MRKTGILIIATALITSVITLSGSMILQRKTDSPFIPENKQVHFTSNPSRAISSAGNYDFVRAAAAVTPAVVHLKTLYVESESRSSGLLEDLLGIPAPGRSIAGSGSGVIISPDGYIITNNHVVENASQIDVILPDRRTFKGEIVGTDPTTDLALVKIQGKDLPVVPLGNSDAVQIGEWVLAVGYPLSLSSTVTAGIVSAKGRNIGILDRSERNGLSSAGTAVESFIQTDAAINPGNSGGALVNTDGQLIGINAAIASQTGSYTGYGFAIPVNLAKKIINDLKQFGEVRRAYIGVSFPSPAVEDELLKQQGIDPGKINGVYITDVQSGSAASSAGLKAGDIIQQIDGLNVSSSAEFSEQIARRRPGEKIVLQYLRDGKKDQATVTLKGQESLSALARNNRQELELQQRFGATFAPLEPSFKQRYRLKSGIVITAIESGGFFYQAGIPVGTIITTLNGDPVNTVEDFSRLLGTSRNGMARIEGITSDGASFIFNFPLGA